MNGGSQDQLQFEKAEFAQDPPAGAVCAYCQDPLGDSYYEVSARVACPRCKDKVATQGTQGSRFGRFARATVFGAGAGAVGASLWYAVRALSGYEIGLIAILVGYMVGVAVRVGSRGRGGPLYQVLAVFLTYAAIVSTYVPMIVSGIMRVPKTHQGKSSKAVPQANPAADAPVADAPAAAEGGEERPIEAIKLTPGKALLALGAFALVVGALAFAAPFLQGFENVIGVLIIGFGVWEAWKINRRTAPTIAGPFRVAAPARPALPSE